VPNARQLRFAPNGELFVASPNTATTGGGPNTSPAIVVIPDDNHDGLGDAQVQFLAGPAQASTQGLMFANGNFYYQSDTQILSMPYAPGTRVAPGPGSPIVDITLYTSALHWPKVFDMADDGTIYVGNGGDQGEACDTTRPFHGGILAIDGSAGGAPVAKGLRNPIALRCWHGHGTCFALELSKDYSAAQGGREKMIPVRAGDDWGFPCCATKGVAYSGLNPVPDCSAIAADTDSFLIGDTPFGLDFEPGLWPAPFTNDAIVTTHGAAGSWAGARVVAIAMDPDTGLAVPATNADGGQSNSMVNFAAGWDDRTSKHGRPAAVTFANDGRLFLSNDNNGVIVWIAPMSL
jgi:glucose/arabinose dehydrogenase